MEVALILELLLGKKDSGTGCFVVITFFSAIDGAIQEQRAKKAIGFLDTKLTVTTRVKRDQNWQTRAARDLVVNDLIHLRIGDIVPADATILNGDLDLDESSLTGESGNVHKKNGELIFFRNNGNKW
ncbi:P-type ATPase [Paucilactobacillus hokkaidonensis]|uniref:P-type ATPase n=1 Tax=Paucilactobacillus hokkaidonensis TaxID=1193095 RepID=UPI000A5CAFBC|nr:hypothetical protein [Paucilactobacillus hokkaidonensis]